MLLAAKNPVFVNTLVAIHFQVVVAVKLETTQVITNWDILKQIIQ